MKGKPAASPDLYVGALSGWQRACVSKLRSAVRLAASVDESIKWGHLVYESGGPVLFIRAEDTRVLFGFWRGQRLLDIQPELKPGGKYEMATMAIAEGGTIDESTAAELVKAAVALNEELGDPRDAAKATPVPPGEDSARSNRR